MTAADHATPAAPNNEITNGSSGLGPVLVPVGVVVLVGNGTTSTLKAPLNTLPKVSLT